MHPALMKLGLSPASIDATHALNVVKRRAADFVREVLAETTEKQREISRSGVPKVQGNYLLSLTLPLELISRYFRINDSNV